MSDKRHGDVFYSLGRYVVCLEGKEGGDGEVRYAALEMKTGKWGNYFGARVPFPTDNPAEFNLFDLFKEVVDEA